MKSTGLVFKSRDYIGSAEPPATVLEDESRYGNHLDLQETAAWTQLPSGLRVLGLDGDSDYAIKTMTDFRGNDFQGSFSCWFYRDALGSTEFLFSSARTATPPTRYLILRVLNSNVFQVGFNDGAANFLAGDSTVAAEVWSHAVLTSTGSTYAVYYNTVAESLTGTNNGNWFADTTTRQNIVIGANIDSIPDGWWAGRIGLPKFWNYALSAGKIKQIFEAERHWFGV